MGQRTAALGCQRSTRSVAFIYTSSGRLCTVYIDDFIGVSPPMYAISDFVALGELLRDLGLEENQLKACDPSTLQVALGVQFDTTNMTMSVTQERLRDTHVMLRHWLRKRTVTKAQLQHLIGKLLFISKCVRSSRVFVNRLLRLLRTLPTASSKAKVTVEFRKDLAWWARFLDAYNGVSIIPHIGWTSADSVLATDACLTGGGAVSHSLKRFVHFQFPEAILSRDLHIHQLELLVVLAAVRLWAVELRGQRLRLYCDNSPSVHAVNSGRTNDGFVSSCLRELWLVCSLHDIELRLEHIPGVENRLADWLSRWHLDAKYRDLFLASVDDNYIDVPFDVKFIYFSDDL